jgi:outer membrane protein assembly factor BamB
MFVSRSSPRIDGSLAILGGGGPEQVIAINLRTHRIAWRTVFPRAVGGLDDTPLAIAHGLVIGEALIGNPHQSILAPHTQVLFALRATTGQRVWETPLAVGPEPRYKQGATPTIAGRTVYVGSVVAPGLWAVQRTTGQIRWHIASDSPIPRPPLVWGSHVWAVTTAGTLLRTTRAGYPVFPMTLGRWANVFGPIIVGSTWAITGNTVDAGILQVRPWTRFLVSQPTRQPGSHA